jgi:hypothetical protein
LALGAALDFQLQNMGHLHGIYILIIKYINKELFENEMSDDEIANMYTH